MNRSRGTLYFHRLFTVRELGFGNPEPFVGPLIRQFLKIGEAVAGRWIEMPHGILILQMVPGSPASGAIYLYDRSLQVFYMIGFDGDEDNLTLEEFNQLLTEYNLVRYAEQPSLAQSDSPVVNVPTRESQTSPMLVISLPSLPPRLTKNCRTFYFKPSSRWYPFQALRHVRCQSVGSA